MEKHFWEDKNIFITGCTGFLGSWLTAELVKQGANIVGLIRDRVPQSLLVNSGIIDHIRVAHGDICDYHLVERVIAEYEVDTIFHLAAQTQVTIANRSPMSTFETNIKGTWQILEAARHNPTVERIVIASSDKAYGVQTELPYREDAPLQGRFPYDVSKSCADLISLSYAHSYGMPVAVTRFANLYGGGDLNWRRIVPGTIKSVLRNEQPIIRSDGTFQRDYIYMMDAVRGYLIVGENVMRDDVRGEAFNFGMDKPATALEMVETIIKISDHPELKPVILDQAENEIPHQYLDSAKAHKLLGWKPQYDLEAGLNASLKWYESYFLENNPDL
ncbi:MAG: GDP-mannose 4,6-dehydratase [Anaerolineales bacterium]|nr:GDP-mannose 4,6-dehydratase [Anaerolineales bacterium]